jgi:hypothetical protein
MPDTQTNDPFEWAERNSRLNGCGSRHYNRGICVTMNMVDKRVGSCGHECAWVYPYGFVPEAGCLIHD